MFKTIRGQNPDLPIIMMSRPKHTLNDEEEERRRIIETTYNNAVEDGDENVYFISGEELSTYCKDDGTVDGCHPNDFGFASIAKVLGETIECILF